MGYTDCGVCEPMALLLPHLNMALSLSLAIAENARICLELVAEGPCPTLETLE